MMESGSFLNGFVTWSNGLVQNFGYLGIFIISFVGSASIFLPVPTFTLIFVFGAILNPWLVGFSAAIGSALGELTGYAVGLGGKKIIEKKNKRWLRIAEKWSEKYAIFWIILLFAVTPLPDDVIGIVAGAVNYDVKKFLLASFTGKLILSLSLALGGFYGIRWVLTVFGV
ncbi:MAG: DedA family protein [Candidatus Aenigmarchaeota archaeon]|nr:DedA family protein [Candidatus Aenigmarchaeota archaeon]